MKYQQLGKTDIEISAICLGTMTWGQQNTQQQAFKQMDYALDHGVNFFDTAEMYPVPPRPETQGSTEHILGNWLNTSGNRDRIILASKVTGRSSANGGVGHVRNGPRLSREHIHAAIDTSLQRLQTDYLDLYQVHWPERSSNFFGKLGYQHQDDDGISIQETLSALAELVTQGKVRHIGISNETPWGTMEYLRLSRELNLPSIASIQNPYNLLNRSFEVGLAECAMREQVSMLAYSPLAFGVLSGKYLNGAAPTDARITLFDRFGQRYSHPSAELATQAYVDLAKQHQLDPAQMALAYVNSREFVGSTIIGATSMAQLTDNIASVDIQLSDEVMSAIEAIHRRISNPAP